MIIKNLGRRTMQKYRDDLQISSILQIWITFINDMIFKKININRWIGKDKVLTQAIYERYNKKYTLEHIAIVLELLYFVRDNGLTYGIPNDVSNILSDMFVDVMLNSTSILEDNFEENNNDYFKNIKIPHKTFQNFGYEYNSFSEYELIMIDEEDIYKGVFSKDIFVSSAKFAISKKSLKYPCIVDKDRYCWMSITSNEINTMKKPIEDSKGIVCTLGLGLGYFAYMCHLKENVKEVIIVEKEDEVISMFTKYILPQFKYPEKIKIIHSDAYDFLDTLQNYEIEYIFADIWQNVVDGMYHYIKIRKFEKRFPNITFKYWIENAILLSIQKYIFGAILHTEKESETILNATGYNIGTLIKEDFKNLVIEKPTDFEKIKNLDYIKSFI